MDMARGSLSSRWPYAQAFPMRYRYTLLIIFAFCFIFFYNATTVLYYDPALPPSTPTIPSAIHEEDVPPFVHFTHVFSSFKGKKPEQRFEYDAVMRSWQDAIAHAEQNGIRVEHVDAILPEDIDSVPPFTSETVFLKHRAQMVGGLKVPLVGEIFKAGAAGKGKWLVYTNSDIALVPTFYVKLWKFLTTDFTSDAFLQKTFRSLVEYKVKCLRAEASKKPRLCDEDSRVLFENIGGFGDLYEQISEDVALSILKTQLQRSLPTSVCENSANVIHGLCGEAAKLVTKQSAVSVVRRRKAMVESMYRIVLGRPIKESSLSRVISHWKPDGIPVIMNTEFVPRSSVSSLGLGRSRPRTALTITRVDVPFERESELERDQLMETIAQKGKIHPGNDCFVMPRAQVPKMLTDMTHPVGLRPWGQWVPDIFRWSEHFTWRRIIGRPQDPYTFHVGMGLWGGSGEDKWKARAKGEKELILFLAAQWYKVSNGEYSKTFKVPPYCNNIALWRAEHYCRVVQSGNCRGSARFACAPYQHPKSRDVLVYLQSCTSLSTGHRGLAQPLCDFCNFLRQGVGTGAQKSRAFNCLQQDLTAKYLFAVTPGIGRN